MEGECDFCDDGKKCLKCHMEAKQELKITKAYRWKNEKEDRHCIDDLEKKNNLKFILGGFYAVLEFEAEGKAGEKKTLSFNEFLRADDEDFFGDRPGVYAFHTDSKEGKVGQSRNLSQRLTNHSGKSGAMNDGTKGFIVFCCKDDIWQNDPLNSEEMRLTIERILQYNFMVEFTDPRKEKMRVEKWVTPTKEQLAEAIKICDELFNKTDFPKSFDSFKLPQVG